MTVSEKPHIRMIHGDCMEFMRGLPNNAYELAIVDPPYGIGEHGGKRREGPQSAKKSLKSATYLKKEWDDNTPDQDYFSEIFRASRDQIIWGGNYFIDKIRTPTAGWVVWDKKTNDGSDFADCEIAWTSFDRAIRKFKYDWIGFGYLNNPQGERKIHPTQKPVALYKWLLQNYAKPGDKILDTHGGSGSIAIACYDMGFDLDWIELDSDYYEAAVKRFNQHKAQPTIFHPVQPEVKQGDLL